MKKRLFLVPLISMLALTGCDLFKKKDNTSGDGGNSSGLPPEDTTDHSPILKEEFGDYELAKTLTNGARYVLAVYKHEDEYVRFFNGDFHRDANGHYPFYMGSSFDLSSETPAEVEVNFVSDDEFTMKVYAPGKVWDQHYIGVYSAHGSGGGPVMSIAYLSSPDQTEYVTPNSDGTIPAVDEDHPLTDVPSAKFKFHTVENDVKLYAPAADYKYAELGDSEATPKYLGTGLKFQSIDCKVASEALDGLTYDLAHLYQKKVAA